MLMWSGPRNNKVKGNHIYCVKIEVFYTGAAEHSGFLGCSSVFGCVVANIL